MGLSVRSRQGHEPNHQMSFATIVRRECTTAATRAVCVTGARPAACPVDLSSQNAAICSPATPCSPVHQDGGACLRPEAAATASSIMMPSLRAATALLNHISCTGTL